MVNSRNTKIVDGVQYNQCTKCENWFPATDEYFHQSNNIYGFNARCRECQKELWRDREPRTSEAHRQYHREYERSDKYKHIRKEWELKNREKLLAYYKKYNDQHKNKRALQQKKLYKNNKDVVKKEAKIYRNKIALFASFYDKLTIDENPKNDGNGYLLVKCTYCGKYFYPTNMDIIRRIQVFNGTVAGENRLYCSDGCKDACPIFNQKKWPKGFKKATSREVNPLIRQMCLARDDYECQRCGKTIKEIELHSHHIEGTVQQPMLANDVENTITLCKPCHKLVHTQEGCTYYDLRCNK